MSLRHASLVLPNGFSISLVSEWIENPLEQAYDKQDCERKAFTRLVTRLKQAFPRLPILIVADGLYPYEGFFVSVINSRESQNSSEIFLQSAVQEKVA